MRRILAFAILLTVGLACPAVDRLYEVSVTPARSQEAQPEDSPRISVDFPNEEIVTILRNVADMYELNLIMPETLKGKRTSLKLRNVTWRQIFREALAPAGYTFIEDENIVRVVSQEKLAEYQSAQAAADTDNEEEQPCELPAWLYWLAAPIALVHLVFTLGVLRDKLPGSARFAPKLVWALAILVGGLLPLLVYWTIHHSSLARLTNHDQPPVLS
jgi:hypothetical protein